MDEPHRRSPTAWPTLLWLVRHGESDLHARAGDVLARRRGRDGFLARELLAEIPPLLARLSGT
jgi:hypothetical protein